MFEPQKPDIAAYSHIMANFGPGRPGGTHFPCDMGTSAAAPVAAGVAALLLSARPSLSQAKLRQTLIDSSTIFDQSATWNPDYGHGVVNAAAAYRAIV